MIFLAFLSYPTRFWFSRCRELLALCFFLACLTPAHAQAVGGIAPPQPGVSGTQTSVPFRPDYILAPNDQILVRVPQEEQINERPFRVDSEGFVTLPVAGRIRAEGLTVQALEAQVATKLREYIRDPLVSITVVQYRSEPVFFVGAFRAPGIYPLQGRRTLVEMMAAVGGVLPNASRRIRVTRRAEAGPIPLAQAVTDPEKKTSTIEVSMASLTENINPEEDLILLPYDIVNVEMAERVYVTGEVARASAIQLGERESISVLQALTEAGGFTATAKRDKVVILRPVLGTNRRAMFEVDMNRALQGEELDLPLLPNDVLYVQKAAGKAFLIPVATSALTSLPFVIVTLLVR